MAEPRIVFPNGLTSTQARRLADIADALEPLGPVTLIDPSLYTLVERCETCGWEIEGGHCYTCRPVFGYGEGRRPING